MDADVLLPVLLGVAVAASWAVIGLRIHARMGNGMDLAIFDQAVRALSHFQAPTSAMKSAGMNLWGDHFHPVILLAVPFYWLWDDPRTLILLQAGSVGCACALLYRAAIVVLPPPNRHCLALLLGLGLSISPGVQSASLFDVHEVAFGVPILALALTALLQQRWARFMAFSLALLLVKEDMGLLVLGMAWVAFARGARRLAVLLGAIAMAWTALVVKVVIPALSPTGTWLYAGSVAGPVSSLHGIADALTTGRLPWMLLVMGAGAGFIALGSPLALALVPCLLARAASGNPVYTGLDFHYNLLPAVVLAFATLDTLRRLRPSSRNRRLAVMLLALAVVVGMGVLTQRENFRSPGDPARSVAARRAMDVVPDGAPVAADVFLTPHLTRSHPVTQQVRPSDTRHGIDYLDDLNRPLAAEWIVLDRHTIAHGGGQAWVSAASAHFRANHYLVAWNRDGYVVLHNPRVRDRFRPSAPSTPIAAPDSPAPRACVR